MLGRRMYCIKGLSTSYQILASTFNAVSKLLQHPSLREDRPATDLAFLTLPIACHSAQLFANSNHASLSASAASSADPNRRCASPTAKVLS